MDADASDTLRKPPSGHLSLGSGFQNLHLPVSDRGGPFYRWPLTFTTFTEGECKLGWPCCSPVPQEPVRLGAGEGSLERL